jgi:thiosulfate dehydrogenase
MQSYAEAVPNDTTWDRPALTPDEAWDAAAYVLMQALPHKAGIENDFPMRAEKPVDAGYGPYVDSFDQMQHKPGPFGPIKAAAPGARPSD